VAKEETTERKDTAAGTSKGEGSKDRPAAASGVRTRIAQLVWLICVLCALVLALGALLAALKANGDKPSVQFVMEAASAVDLGVFDRGDGVLTHEGDNATTKNALVNWGLGAVVWLIVGRILDRIIRP
jgi:hypothetical protein